jgi:translation elongation factor EF-G
MLSASPKLMETIYEVELFIPEKSIYIEEILNFFKKKRNFKLISENKKLNSNFKLIKFYLPVEESFGVNDELKFKFNEIIFCFFNFYNWEIMEGDPFTDCFQRKKNLEIRKLKGLKEDIPNLDKFKDKM